MPVIGNFGVKNSSIYVDVSHINRAYLVGLNSVQDERGPI